MPKHTMTQAAARRIAKRLLDADAGVLPYLNSEKWRTALRGEGFTGGYTASTASNVISALRNAEEDDLADTLALRSFEALFTEVMELRERATNLVNAFGSLAKERL